MVISSNSFVYIIFSDPLVNGSVSIRTTGILSSYLLSHVNDHASFTSKCVNTM